MTVMIMSPEEELLTGPTCLQQEGLNGEAGGTVASIRNPECFGFHCALADSLQSHELLLYIVAMLRIIGPEAITASDGIRNAAESPWSRWGSPMDCCREIACPSVGDALGCSPLRMEVGVASAAGRASGQLISIG